MDPWSRAMNEMLRGDSAPMTRSLEGLVVCMMALTRSSLTLFSAYCVFLMRSTNYCSFFSSSRIMASASLMR